MSRRLNSGEMGVQEIDGLQRKSRRKRGDDPDILELLQSINRRLDALEAVSHRQAFVRDRRNPRFC